MSEFRSRPLFTNEANEYLERRSEFLRRICEVQRKREEASLRRKKKKEEEKKAK